MQNIGGSTFGNLSGFNFGQPSGFGSGGSSGFNFGQPSGFGSGGSSGFNFGQLSGFGNRFKETEEEYLERIRLELLRYLDVPNLDWIKKMPNDKLEECMQQWPFKFRLFMEIIRKSKDQEVNTVIKE